MKHRRERFNSVIQKELSEYIVKNIDFDGALVTITSVKTSETHEDASILVSVLPVTKKDGAMKTLEKNAGELQYMLMKKMTTRIVPRIAFKYDEGADKAQAIEKIIIDEGIKSEENKEE